MTLMAAGPQEPSGSVVELTRPGARLLGPQGNDRSGRLRQGEAGVMARTPGERMANGERFDPEAAIAASSTLPLGTTLRVTNLENGRVTMVQVQDLMPRGDDRLLDLSPGSARFIQMVSAGTRVQVAPLAVPQADGSFRLGEGTGLAGQRAAMAVSERPRD
ncbi:septal ring lytic transglycosylase RlpA family protein [Roseomonas sp. OT10]|uniref:septal ring lytic transglycosylase RlpA family protein n=1 Tax=Roseomonas cutis TaxID=2897332 RepID=UPI001E56D12E|nr:septal ring lytic transglycosylase RlpA family protein [Roseomonas sp. OT10]UFN49593.1 septal ring lytic transglycosylase RlpA family protein [Roseomonas sp. OT10]